MVSILLAFAIQAWWESSQERERERQLLAGLHAEFTENLGRLNTNLAGHESIRDAALALLEVSDSGTPVSRDSIAELLKSVFIDAYSYNPTVGTLEGLIASGELRLISNAELRSVLAAWPGLIEENAEDELWVFRNVQTIYTPYLNGVVPTRSIWSWSNEVPRDPRGGQHPDLTVAFSDPRFQDLVSMRSYGARLLIGENKSLRDVVQEILVLVAEELPE